MPNLGPTELIIILVIVVIVFGVGRLPEIGGAVGKAIREFREASSGVESKESESPKSSDSDKGS
jgi:sec-independent protein translocase protein TatA